MTKCYVDANGVFLFSFDGDVDGPEGSTEVPTAPADARQVWDFVAEEWGPAPAPEPVIYLNNGGLARFTGTVPPQTLEAIRMSGATRVSKGRYRAYHVEAYPSDQYSAMPSVFDANPRTIRVTARTTTYVEVRVTDLAGAVQDPQEITIKTERIVTE